MYIWGSQQSHSPGTSSALFGAGVLTQILTLVSLTWCFFKDVGVCNTCSLTLGKSVA